MLLQSGAPVLCWSGTWLCHSLTSTSPCLQKCCCIVRSCTTQMSLVLFQAFMHGHCRAADLKQQSTRPAMATAWPNPVFH